VKLVTKISFRNLLRQKRRNILLGAAIALGVMILVVANSFSAGITDILLNKIIVRVAGHIQVAFNEKGRIYRTIFRDKERIVPLIRNNVEGVRELEESIGVFGRIIGNKKADNLIFVGIDLSQKLSEETRREVEESMKMIEGEFKDLTRTDIENPVILSQEKAQYLNVKKNDILRMRFTNLFGNDESARLTVIGIVRNDNIFMQTIMYGALDNVKKLMGFKPYEVANLNITIENPTKNAVKLADKLHASLNPNLAFIYGNVKYKGREQAATMLGLKADDDSKKVIKEHIQILSIDKKDDIFSKKAVLLNEALGDKLGIKVGDPFELVYRNKFKNTFTTNTYKVTGIFHNDDMADKNIVLLHEELFYDTYYPNLPEDKSTIGRAYLPDRSNPLYNILATEWVLLNRTSNTEELQKKMKDISRKKWKGTTVDVRTMYESASEVLKLEQVLNLITVTAVLILFFIILIGVINTLRMTIRERTREIGTIRAIGMQKKDVRNVFILESFLLAFFSSMVGVMLAFLSMYFLTILTFELPDNPLSILLVNGHLYFKPTWIGILLNIVFILAIVAVTAYFPARRAANLSPSTALRHYE